MHYNMYSLLQDAIEEADKIAKTTRATNRKVSPLQVINITYIQ